MIADQTTALIREGYGWGARVRRSEAAVPIRFLGRRAVVVGGADGARRFYDPRLLRRGAVPAPLKLVLFGAGAVHGLDDRAHRWRKKLFVEHLTRERVADLARLADASWTAAIERGATTDDFTQVAPSARVIAAAVLPWAGLPQRPDDLERRTRQFVGVVDGFATPVRPYLRAVLARRQTESWLRAAVRDARAARRPAPSRSALAAASFFRDQDGRLLPVAVAAVELHNLIRPTIAVAWYVAFAAATLERQPRWCARIRDEEPGVVRAVSQELRRLYPFVPVLAARARTAQDVLGVPLRRGQRILLDVHGTDHDPAHWTDPEAFDPERFLHPAFDDDALVPQGGGEVATGHRCPGEEVTLTLIDVAVTKLASLPPRSSTAPAVGSAVRYDPTRMPTTPTR